MIMIMFMGKHKLMIRKGTKGCKVQGAICKVVNLYYCHQIIASNVIKIFVKILSSQVRMREVQGAICIASIVQLVIGYTGVCIVVYTFVCIIVYTSVCIIGYTGVCIILVHICLYYCLHRCLHYFYTFVCIIGYTFVCIIRYTIVCKLDPRVLVIISQKC